MPPQNYVAFRNTARQILLARASDYVMWCAGHGADSSTILAYMDSLSVFPSHFHEWADHLSRDEILSSIPVLSRWLPGADPMPQGLARIPAPAVSSIKADPPPAVSLPPVVAAVVTLAIQQHILLNGKTPSPVAVEASLSYADLLFAAFGIPRRK